MSGKFPRQVDLQIHKRNGARSQGEVAEDARFAGSDGYVGASEVSLLVLGNEAANEVIQRRLAAYKRRSLMMALELLDMPINHGRGTASRRRAGVPRWPLAGDRAGPRNDRGRGRLKV